jgi:predicted peptidase
LIASQINRILPDKNVIEIDRQRRQVIELRRQLQNQAQQTNVDQARCYIIRLSVMAGGYNRDH